MSWNPGYYRLASALETFFFEDEADFPYDEHEGFLGGDWNTWLRDNDELAMELDIVLTKIKLKRMKGKE